MIDRIKETQVAQHAWRFLDKVQAGLAPRILRQRTFALAALAIVAAVVYWGFIASDRYVSEAVVVIQRTDMPSGATVDIANLLTGAGLRSDQLLLRAHLRSLDMLKKLDEKLDLRDHYSDKGRDVLSRMWRKDEDQERFYEYFLSRTSVELDEYTGALNIKAQAYDAKMAKAIADLLVSEGELYMNEVGHAMVRDQVHFLEKQIVELGNRNLLARKELLAYQNRNGMISPDATAENLQGTINRLEAHVTELKTKRASLLGYLTPSAPAIVDLNLQIQAVERQIVDEQSRLTSPKSKALNATLEEYQRLEITAKFTQDLYKTALVAMERGRLESLRTLKKVSVLQSPSLPEYPLEPRRIYNIVVFILAALILAGIVHLMAAIIRDHLD